MLYIKGLKLRNATGSNEEMGDAFGTIIIEGLPAKVFFVS